jgi:uncharacterized protein (TIGR03083 family)
MTTTDTARAARTRRSALDRETAMRLAATEYQRFLDQIRTLEGTDWAAPTDCPAWDVRAMATHNLGMAVMASSFREMVRQNMKATKRGGVFIDALTGLQVEERSTMTPDRIVRAYAGIVELAARGRRRRSVAMARVPMPVTETLNGVEERWTFGFLYDTILTRDTWMHRIDISRATGHSLKLTAGHDDVLVADVVDEWAGRHGKPCQLHLTGEAGGTWTFGDGGPALDLDAIDFNRTLSGREHADDLLAVAVPY